MKDIAFLYASMNKNILVETDTLNGGSVEIAPKISESIGITVDATDVVSAIGKHISKLRSDTTAADNDDVAHLDLSHLVQSVSVPIIVIRRAILLRIRIADGIAVDI